MAVDVFGIENKAPQKARKFIIGRYALRYAIMFCFIAMIVTRTDFNIIATFIGLFFVQMSLVVGQVFHGTNIAGKFFKGIK